MPRQIHVNGMRAIILHNIFKQNKRLTKENKKEIIDFVNTLSIEELKQKGLTKQIISQFKDGKPRKTITGGMKRSNEGHSDQPIKRSFFEKAVGTVFGESPSDERYTLDKRINDLKKIFNSENELEKDYQTALDRTRQAKLYETSTLSDLQNVRNQKILELEKTTNYLKHRKDFLEEIEDNYKDLVPIFLANDRSKINDSFITDLKVYDAIYYRINKRHLPHFEEIMKKLGETMLVPSLISVMPIHMQLPPPLPPAIMDASLASSSSSIDLQPPQLPPLPIVQPVEVPAIEQVEVPAIVQPVEPIPDVQAHLNEFHLLFGL